MVASSAERDNGYFAEIVEKNYRGPRDFVLTVALRQWRGPPLP